MFNQVKQSLLASDEVTAKLGKNILFMRLLTDETDDNFSSAATALGK